MRGQETLLKGREGYGGPPKDRERSGVPPGDPGGVGRFSHRAKKLGRPFQRADIRLEGLGGVGSPTQRARRIRVALLEV